MGTQMDSLLAFTASLGLGGEVVLFTLAWTFVKVFCFDAGGIVLALSAGILFGGVLKGAVASAAAATIGSSVAFGLAKIDTPIRKKALEVLDEYPSLRGIEKVVAKDGIKAILTLRLAPVLPIPIGLYNYIYGVTNVPILDFATGIFLGSLKPYLLDSYLGLFGKSLIDGTGGDSATEDYILLVALGVSTLIGVFASQLASETWEAVQKEVEEEKQIRQDEDNVEDEIPRSIMEWDLPQFMIDTQIALKQAEQRLEDTIAKEMSAKVWNYTKLDEIPEGMDPAKAVDSPEITGRYKGFQFGNAICDGIVLSPVLLKTFFEFSDPLFDEEERLQNMVAGSTTSVKGESGSMSMSADQVLTSVAQTELKIDTLSKDRSNQNVDTIQKDIDSYLFDTLERTKSNLEKSLKEMDINRND